MHYCLFVIFILLLNFECRTFRPVGIECDWSVERLQCPTYGTTDWVCLKAQLNCSGGKDYHCVRDERGNWIQICAEAKTCHKGQEPVYSKDSGITCQSCRNSDRFEPIENTESYKFSECRRIKKNCPTDVSYECPDESVKYYQNRICRCAYKKNFIPQNYDFNTDTWMCKDPDELNCIKETCPEAADGKTQTRGSDYRCHLPSDLPFTPSPSKKPVESTSAIITEKPTTRSKNVNEKEDVDFLTWFGIGVAVLLLLTGVVSLVLCKVFKLWSKVCKLWIKQLDFPGEHLEASDIKYTELTLSWQHRETDEEALLTDYILDKREVSTTSHWQRIDIIPAAKPEYHVTGLKPGTAYSFSVRAKYNKGKSMPIETEKTVQTKKIRVPDMPKGPVKYCSKTATAVTLSWEPPDDNGGTPILKYLIKHRIVAEMSWEGDGNVKGDIITWTQNGLTKGFEYEFRVFAVNEKGVSDPLESEDTVKLLAEPNTPSKIEIIEIDINKVTVTWERPDNDGGTNITAYRIKQKEGESEWQVVGIVTASKFSYKIMNQTIGKSYNFGVCAQNKIGNGDYKETTKRIGPPDPPLGQLEASDVQFTELTLSWKQPDYDGGSQLIGYSVDKVERRSIWTLFRPKTTTYRVTGLQDGTQHHFVVKAMNVRGSSQPLEIDVTTKSTSKPGPPVGPVRYTNVTADSVTVSWNLPVTDGGSPVTGYCVEKYDVNADSWKTAQSVSKDITALTLKKLIEGSGYRFRIYAINSNGESVPLESKDTVKPKRPIVAPTKPESFRVKDIKEDRLVLTWKPPKNDGGSKILRYHIYMDKNVLKSIDNVDADINEYLVVNLIPDKKYKFEVLAENIAGYGEATDITPTTKKLVPPSVPIGPLRAVDIDETELTLIWKPPKFEGEHPLLDYIVQERQFDVPKWVSIGKVRAGVTEYHVTGLTKGKQYYFSVSAKNKKGQSQPLEIDGYLTTTTLTVPLQPRGPITFTDLTETSVRLTWRQLEKGSSPVTEYLIEFRDAADSGEFWTTAGSVTEGMNTWTQTDLLEGHEYLFHVVAKNAKGESEPLKSKKLVVPKQPVCKTENGDNMDRASQKAAEQPKSMPMEKAVASVGEKDFRKTHPSRKSDPGPLVSDTAKRFEQKGTEVAAEPIRKHAMRISSKNDTQEIAKKIGLKDSAADSVDQVDDGNGDGEDKAGSLKDWKEQEEIASKFLNFIGVDKKSTSWEDLKIYGSVNKEQLNDGCKVPATPLQQLIGTQYKIGKSILLKGFKAYEVSGNDNFLFKSVSCALFGNENCTHRLRLKTVFDGIENCNVYVNQFLKDKDKARIKHFMNYCLSKESLQELDHDKAEDQEYLAEFTVQMAVRETAISESMSNPLQVQFLSNTISMPILQYFQGNKNFFGEPVVDACELATPAGMIDSVKECVRILWAHDTKLGKSGLKGLNYIVPVAKKG